MDAEEIDAAAAAAELNILGGLASVTGIQSPAPTRPAGATANDASKDEASPTPSAPAAPSGVANDSPQGAVPATPSAVTITTEQLAMLGGIMATAMKDAMGAAGGTTPGSTLCRSISMMDGSLLWRWLPTLSLRVLEDRHGDHCTILFAGAASIPL